ncbi:MAG: M20/M25/M40 family metallo-hydrolase [Nitrospira sp.]|nr:M20/M25/M40 family metallo-hydrolase [Nitrospira sp.]
MVRYGRYVASLFVRHAVAGVVAFLVSTGGWVGATDRPVGGWDEGTVGAELHKLVQALAVTIGPRSYMDPANLDAAADLVSNRLAALGYPVTEQSYQAEGLPVRNIIAERRGTEEPDRVIVVGAHYDTVVGSPGADDNASGVAVLLELARLHADTHFRKTVRFVGFTLEEPPFFRSRHMGSRVYTRALKERGERVEAMLCLESVGYYSQEPGSQSFPWPVFWLRWRYPSTGNFLTIVGNTDSRPLQEHVRDVLTSRMALPVETYTGPWWIPGVDWSDHGSFWNEGYPAVMLTDTALFRNPHYHSPSDLPERLDYPAMAELVRGLVQTLTSLDERQ